MNLFESKDSQGDRFTMFSIKCVGARFHISVPVGTGGNVSSKTCLDAFIQHWVSWAGWPEVLVRDRGLHNLGALARALIAQGCL